MPAGWLTVAVQLYEGPCRQLREESEPLAYFPTMKTAKEKHFLPVTLTLRQTFDSAPFRPNRKSTWCLKKKKSFWSHIFKQNFIRHWQTRNEQKTVNSWFFFFFFICLTLLNIFYRLSGLGHKRRRAYIQSFLKLLLYLTRRHDKHGKCFKKYVKSLLNKNNVYCCLLVCLYCCLLEKWQTSHF